MISTTYESGSGENEELQTVIRMPSSPGKYFPEMHETYQMLLSRIGWPAAPGQPGIKTLGFTSCYPQEGVSTVAAHVALSAVHSGPERVALVDLNFARPSVHQTLEIQVTPGVRDILSGEIPTEDALHRTPHSRFLALPVGTPAQQSTVYQISNLRYLLDELCEGFDLVVFDLPGCNEASCTLSVAGLLDGVCMVMEAERVRTEVALRTKELLARSGANLLGAVVNKQRHHVPRWLYRTL